SVFLYRTLMHPKILKRVLGYDAMHPRICPAILTVPPCLVHTRHKVEFADYPRHLPSKQSKTRRSSDMSSLNPEEDSVRGTLVAGLTARDIALL
ncbi:hypothetical protein BC826DRAFT_891033, partial [Russula brevipes]